MKLITGITLALSLSAMGMSATAADHDSENLALCKADLKGMFGPDTGLKLKSLSRRRSGDQLRIRVAPAEGDAQTVTCVVDREGVTSLLNSDGVALLPPVHDGGDTVTLND